MQTENRFFDDLARVTGGALGVLSGFREEIEALFKDRLQRALDSLDLVNREEFEAVKAMAAKARAEQEKLESRLLALEAQLGGKKATKPRGGGSTTRTTAKTATKATAKTGKAKAKAATKQKPKPAARKAPGRPTRRRPTARGRA